MTRQAAVGSRASAGAWQMMERSGATDSVRAEMGVPAGAARLFAALARDRDGGGPTRQAGAAPVTEASSVALARAVARLASDLHLLRAGRTESEFGERVAALHGRVEPGDEWR